MAPVGLSFCSLPLHSRLSFSEVAPRLTVPRQRASGQSLGPISRLCLETVRKPSSCQKLRWLGDLFSWVCQRYDSASCVSPLAAWRRWCPRRSWRARWATRTWPCKPGSWCVLAESFVRSSVRRCVDLDNCIGTCPLSKARGSSVNSVARQTSVLHKVALEARASGRTGQC